MGISLDPEVIQGIADAISENIATRLTKGDEPWFDVEGAAWYLACSPKRIYDLVAQQRLSAARDGRRLLFRREWLDAALEFDSDATSNGTAESVAIRGGAR